MTINSLFCFLLQTMLTIFTGAPKGTNAIVQHLCAKHNHHCVVKIPSCSSWATNIALLQRSELEKATQDVNAVALRSYKVLSSPILISQVKSSLAYFFFLYFLHKSTTSIPIKYYYKYTKYTSYYT